MADEPIGERERVALVDERERAGVWIAPRCSRSIAAASAKRPHEMLCFSGCVASLRMVGNNASYTRGIRGSLADSPVRPWCVASGDSEWWLTNATSQAKHG